MTDTHFTTVFKVTMFTVLIGLVLFVMASNNFYSPPYATFLDDDDDDDKFFSQIEELSNCALLQKPSNAIITL